MNHKLAETQHSVEKYTLNEMSPEERLEFEEHMFDCPVCSDLIRQNYTAIQNLNEVLAEPAEQRSSWREWFRMPSLVPTFAALALACVVGYQNFVPSLPPMEQLSAEVVRSAPRGETSYLPVHLDPKAATVELRFEVDAPSGAFQFELDDAEGKKTLLGPSHGIKAPDSDQVNIRFRRKNLPTGRYNLVLRPDTTPDQPIYFPFEVVDSK